MSAKTVQIPLNAADPALCYAWATRSVLNPDALAARVPGNFYGAPNNADYDVPRLIYSENVVPTDGGIVSCDFVDQVSLTTGLSTSVVTGFKVAQLTPPNGVVYYLALDPVFPCACDASNPAAWVQVNIGGLPGVTVFSDMSCVNLGGKSYVFFAHACLTEFNPPTRPPNNLVVQALTLPGGLSLSNILGIGQFSNYMLLYTKDTLYWSTPADPLDFANVDQGAGQLSPLALRGGITGIREASQGFYLLAANNILYASYTGNAAGPFSFKVVEGAGGCSGVSRFSTVADGEGNYYALTTAGVQSIQQRTASTILPELTSFTSGAITEQWNDSLKRVVPSAVDKVPDYLTGTIALLANRFLAFSFLGTGIVAYAGGEPVNAYTDAVIYDTLSKRWGHLKYPHNAIVNVEKSENGTPYTSPWNAVRFVQATGKVQSMRQHISPNLTGFPSMGIAVFGRIQHNRQRLTTITRIEIDGLYFGNVYALVSDYGGSSTRTTVQASPVSFDGITNVYEIYETCLNFDIAIVGFFNLINLQVRVRNHGYR